ncbi:MAG: zinc ribbon domain-containing protein [Coprobacillus sp.]
MFCKQCGKEVGEAKFCPYCGTDQSQSDNQTTHQANAQDYQPIHEAGYEQSYSTYGDDRFFNSFIFYSNCRFGFILGLE